MNSELRQIIQAIDELATRQSAHMEETRRQNETINRKLDELQLAIAGNAKAIALNAKAIAGNATAIAGNARAIAENARAIAENAAEIRKAHVLIEDNRSAIELVAEGVSAANQRIDSLKAEMNERFDSQESFFRSTFGHLATSHDLRFQRIERHVGLN